eukprot:2433438-Pleurochrysis_carterae.AAC.1
MSDHKLMTLRGVSVVAAHAMRQHAQHVKKHDLQRERVVAGAISKQQQLLQLIKQRCARQRRHVAIAEPLEPPPPPLLPLLTPLLAPDAASARASRAIAARAATSAAGRSAITLSNAADASACNDGGGDGCEIAASRAGGEALGSLHARASRRSTQSSTFSSSVDA